jgi:hypothetical protein
MMFAMWTLVPVLLFLILRVVVHAGLGLIVAVGSVQRAPLRQIEMVTAGLGVI